MKALLHAGLIALVLAVAVPFTAAAASPKTREFTVTNTVPMSAAECAWTRERAPEDTCLITFSSSLLETGASFVPVALAASSQCASMQSTTTFWWVREDYCYSYNGSTSWLTWANCSWWGLGWSIDVKWCAAYDGWNYGYNYIDVGANWVRTTYVAGLPIQSSCWMRTAVGANGQRGYFRNGCG